jgi:hypothetical protein
LTGERLWERVGELADLAPRLSDLRYHKLQLVAASRLRARGELVPPELQTEERLAAAIALGAGLLVRRLRAATDARVIVMKGPEAAALWPDSRLRPWKDLDLLVEDAHAVQDALLAAGFVEVGDPALYRDIHHLRPLSLPGLPVAVEVHLRPKWPAAHAPTFDDLAAAAVPSTFGVVGMLAPSPAHHAVLLAAHAWEHDPLSRVGSLADVAAMTIAAGRTDADAVARAWGVARLWSATARAVDEVLLDGRPALHPPIWRRHLEQARERTVLEAHAERLVGPLAGSSLHKAPHAVLSALARTIRPAPGEGWRNKWRRSWRAMRNASLRGSDHVQEERTV